MVICSDHGDHTAGNAEFPTDARFFAHPTSHAVLRAAADNPDRPTTAPPVVVPTDLVETAETLHLGGREIRLLFLGRAHTGGGLVVHLPTEKILFMSEAYLNRVFPAMRSAYPSEWVAMIEAAQALEVDIYVPGHGFVDSPEVLAEELETYRRAVVQVIDEASRLHARRPHTGASDRADRLRRPRDMVAPLQPGPARARPRLHGAEWRAAARVRSCGPVSPAEPFARGTLSPPTTGPAPRSCIFSSLLSR